MKNTIKFKKAIVCLFLVMSIIPSIHGVGDFNGEGDSGNTTTMCSGTRNNICWDVYGDNGRDDGIRITLYKLKDMASLPCLLQ